MTESTLFAGKRGSGKSLAAVAKIAGYLADGRAVATNLNLRVEKLVSVLSEVRWYRLPDWPTVDALRLLPLGNPGLEWPEGEPYPIMKSGYTEKLNGLLVFDEAGTFLNSREWQGQGRAEVIAWLLHSRKFGWDLLFIAQHLNLMDKQVRDSLIDIQGTVRCLDKVSVPLISSVWKMLTGNAVHFPKAHFASLRYGFGQGAPKSDSMLFRGTELFEGYDTLQTISPITGQLGVSSMLSAWELKGRYMNKWTLRRKMAAGGLVVGLLLGMGAGYAARTFKPTGETPAVPITVETGVTVRGVARDPEGLDVVMLSDGRSAVASSIVADAEGARYKVGSKWYKK